MSDPTDLDAHRERIARDGYTVLEGVLSPAQADDLAGDLLRLERELGVVPSRNLFEGRRTVRIYNLLVHGRRYQEIPVHERVLPLVERVLDRGCLVSSLSSVSICPGETAQLVHADDQMIPLPRPRPPIICNTMWALTDFTADNGATRVVPGSHCAARLPELGQPYDTVPMEMKRGSVLVFDGSIWHGGGPNATGERRVGVAMNYCAGYLRQQENQQLGVPLEIARAFPPRLRKLIGYGIYRGLIGHVDKCSPVDLLDGTGPRRVVGEG